MVVIEIIDKEWLRSPSYVATSRTPSAEMLGNYLDVDLHIVTELTRHPELVAHECWNSLFNVSSSRLSQGMNTLYEGKPHLVVAGLFSAHESIP